MKCSNSSPGYTLEEDFGGASLVVTSLGDPAHDEHIEVLSDPAGVPGALWLATLRAILAFPAPATRTTAPTTAPSITAETP